MTGNNNTGSFNVQESQNNPITNNVATGAAGGGGSHSHPFSFSSGSGTVNLEVKYVDLIIAQKN
jgi:hypothetical protein